MINLLFLDKLTKLFLSISIEVTLIGVVSVPASCQLGQISLLLCSQVDMSGKTGLEFIPSTFEFLPHK